jgi:hypothetical protein
MPSTDISACGDGDCPLKDTCWRWIAPSFNKSAYQTYSDFERKPDEVKCPSYWEYK